MSNRKQLPIEVMQQYDQHRAGNIDWFSSLTDEERIKCFRWLVDMQNNIKEEDPSVLSLLMNAVFDLATLKFIELFEEEKSRQELENEEAIP